MYKYSNSPTPHHCLPPIPHHTPCLCPVSSPHPPSTSPAASQHLPHTVQQAALGVNKTSQQSKFLLLNTQYWPYQGADQILLCFKQSFLNCNDWGKDFVDETFLSHKHILQYHPNIWQVWGVIVVPWFVGLHVASCKNYS